MNELTATRIEYLTDKWPLKSRKKGGAIHFGYFIRTVKDSDQGPDGTKEGGDPLSIVPDYRLLDLLEQALDMIDQGISMRKASAWLTEISGKNISYQTLDNIWVANRASETNPRSIKLRGLKELNTPKTRKERTYKTKAQRIGQLKRKKHYLDLKLQKVEEDKIEAKKPVYVEYDYEEVPEDIPVFFRPNPGPQEAFLAASEREVLYGGAAGGGKSYAMVVDPLRYANNPYFNGLLLRRTTDELRKLIRDSQFLYPQIPFYDRDGKVGKAKWSEKSSTWTFPAGGQLWLTYLDRDQDVHRYQGQEYCWIGIDELTQYPTPYVWEYLRSRLRTSKDSGLPLCMRATTNPGGVGHGWVKKMFIDPAVPNTPFWGTNIETGEVLKYPPEHEKFPNKPLLQRKFIPAKVKDNPYLWEDGQYEANLLALPEDQRRQLLEGDWDVADGAAFGEFRSKYHVVEPRHLPHDWRRFRSCDFGYATHSAVHWFTIEPQTNILIVYRELYVSKMTAKDLAVKILDLEKNDNISYGVLDSSCWQVRGHAGPTIAEEMTQMGCRWRPSDRAPTSRTNGKNRLHELLKVDPVLKRPGIEFFNTCRQIISDLPVIPVHPDGKEDIDDRYASDHAYDSLRYGIMSRPRAEDPWVDWMSGPSAKTEGIQRVADNRFGY
jgi:hypothetical protein